MERIVLGTRGSALARTQTGMVEAMLRGRGHDTRIEVLVTRGDQEQHLPVPQLGGKGLFTAELEQALLEGRIDCAVHSLKDLPTDDTKGLCVAAIPPREDWRDALVSKGRLSLRDLPPGARVGTASRRRVALLRAFRSDLVVLPLRGNVDTRVKKALEGDLDAVVLAAAGLARLGRAEVITERLGFLPAPAQGALAIQARADRADVLAALRPLHDETTARCVAAERAVLHALGGGCSVPVGALAVVDGHHLLLKAMVASVDGGRVLTAEGVGRDPEALGRVVAANLREKGATEILDAEA